MHIQIAFSTYIYHEDEIIIVHGHKQASKPIELTRKQLECERDLNCQRVASDKQSLFYGLEKGCNRVAMRSLVVDVQC